MYPQRANILLQGLDRRVLTVGAISGPHCQIGVLYWYHFTSHEFTWSEKCSGEADQLTLASGGSEHDVHIYVFSVAISWGSKMNFNLHANMTGFAQTVTFITGPGKIGLIWTHL